MFLCEVPWRARTVSPVFSVYLQSALCLCCTFSVSWLKLVQPVKENTHWVQGFVTSCFCLVFDFTTHRSPMSLDSHHGPGRKLGDKPGRRFRRKPVGVLTLFDGAESSALESLSIVRGDRGLALAERAALIFQTSPGSGHSALVPVVKACTSRKPNGTRDV